VRGGRCRCRKQVEAAGMNERRGDTSIWIGRIVSTDGHMLEAVLAEGFDERTGELMGL
jgi:hypothetical protein